MWKHSTRLVAELRSSHVTTITYREIKHHKVGYMLAKGLASNTVNGQIKSCKALFKYLFEEGIIHTNLADDLKLVKWSRNDSKQNRHTFTGFRDYTMIMVMLETGMRIVELLEIRVTRGKGGKARRVPLQKTCLKILKQYLEERGDTESYWLFVNVEGTALSIRTVQENIHVYGKFAGISGVRVSPHTFRHTMAKIHILNGGDVFTLQQIRGHSTLDMVRYYVELFNKDIRDQHQKYSPVENMKRYID